MGLWQWSVSREAAGHKTSSRASINESKSTVRIIYLPMGHCFTGSLYVRDDHFVLGSGVPSYIFLLIFVNPGLTPHFFKSRFSKSVWIDFYFFILLKSRKHRLSCASSSDYMMLVDYSF